MVPPIYRDASRGGLARWKGGRGASFATCGTQEVIGGIVAWEGGQLATVQPMDAPTPLVPIDRATAMLHTLQAMLEEAAETRAGVRASVGAATVVAADAAVAAPCGGGLNEWRYLQLCQLTMGLHAQLNVAKAACDGARSGDAHDYDEHDYMSFIDAFGDELEEADACPDPVEPSWRVTHVRQVDGQTVITTSGGARTAVA